MSTNGTIAIANPRDGTVRSIYLHWDADLALEILKRCYSDYHKVMALIELGGLSVLGHHSEQPWGHTFDDPWDGYCVAYHRDRGERLVIDKFDDQPSWAYDTQTPYAFIFENGVWK